MRSKKCEHTLKSWGEQTLENNAQLIFSNKKPFGEGEIRNNTKSNSKPQIIVGTGIKNGSSILEKFQVNDLDFVKLGVTMFHEIGHYERSFKKPTKELQISELSKFGNAEYYEYNWQNMQHEIDAEYTGIMSMWKKMKEFVPDKADKLMLEHLTDRARNTVYMIRMPKEGFTSKTQINSLFEQAYDNASRTLPLGFLRSDDEIARMCTTDDKILRLEYAAIYNKLVTPVSGKEMDKMMASIVSYIHPELQETYSTIDFDSLNPSHIFKIPIPETTDEIRKRLGLDDNFAKAIERLSSDDSQLTL